MKLFYYILVNCKRECVIWEDGNEESVWKGTGLREEENRAFVLVGEMAAVRFAAVREFQCTKKCNSNKILLHIFVF